MTTAQAAGTQAPARASGDVARLTGGALTLAVGAIHLQQYAAVLADVPTIGVLFLLNAVGAGAIAIGLATPLRRLAALGGIGLSAGALVSVAIALAGALFGYSEPDLRPAVALSILVEIGAVAALAAYLLRLRSD